MHWNDKVQTSVKQSNITLIARELADNRTILGATLGHRPIYNMATFWIDMAPLNPHLLNIDLSLSIYM